MPAIQNKTWIFDRYQISQSDFLGAGMEAEVYACDSDKVLKLYNHLSDVHKQKVLKSFYQSIERNGLSYELPNIYEINEEKGSLITFEKRIKGTPLQSQLPQMNSAKLEEIMSIYLNANIEMKSITLKKDLEGYCLFDHFGIPQSKINNWFDLLKEMVVKKQIGLESHFNKDVVNYEGKLKSILQILSAGYKGEYSIIHGDFYPGNLLMDKDRVSGLIDFGIMTMYGDYLFDVAIGWVCFDMYDVLNANIRERYLNMILNTLGENVKSRLYLYVLVYSMITANFYAEDCSDGHYQWCVDNLNNEEFWKTI
ncbi:aminoglycoside phosphotransferase family protein [Bacillus sp. NEB1478]|uniref:aminoglycoside phosphotransferase family protein n=1 Tax=Bacillus sp. NEB1478 TaxID=3073816 RepID=UPI0028738CC0|nr:aminoglycoside phosphotransferase family protein [Bacillus sp. NEB1478]WNB90966.1 aminoglycoside phosphotransferase family protein [Bacillus sp. NEB1478]